MGYETNKSLKWDCQRVAFFVCGDFCDEFAMR
ncbi:DUF3265 domain-containing protein [Vibrio sp. dsl-7]|uniref:DUF3265 domain-containing protein n=1 Tax=Vibrio chanodichtyis TaxID=3027932 RepID=A0ABT5V3H7_9VIBR|nr:DUF3265 domain-containing protein [Vibrio sp. gvc]MDE1515702.1 DUF3265 domain-containing protein [Vibrio chanodichtyis]